MANNWDSLVLTDKIVCEKICSTCGQDHSFRTNKDVKTSIDAITIFIERLIQREKLVKEGAIQ
jgi:hypothetical protein